MADSTQSYSIAFANDIVEGRAGSWNNLSQFAVECFDAHRTASVSDLQKIT